jgi:hypothetical protein
MAFMLKPDTAIFEIAKFLLIHYRVPLRYWLGEKQGCKKIL